MYKLMVCAFTLFYAAPFPSQEEKIEADARSVYVGNVSETESSS